MKKLKLVRIAGLCAMALAVSADAAVSITWSWDEAAGNSVNRADTVTPLPTGNTVQLIWSADASIGAIDPGSPLVPTGGDVVLDTIVTPGDGYWGLVPIAYAGLDALVPGFIYQRVFDDVDGGGIGVTDLYGNGEITAVSIDTAPPTAGANASYLWDSAASGGPFVVNTPIPEPSSMMLAGLGMAVLAIRRKLRK